MYVYMYVYINIYIFGKPMTTCFGDQDQRSFHGIRSGSYRCGQMISSTGHMWSYGNALIMLTTNYPYHSQNKYYQLL